MPAALAIAAVLALCIPCVILFFLQYFDKKKD